ncbi:DUF4241 domain-containing protein [Enemella sp. A6]|uniref:DUF4241 domain-containing protein n=1 Tax=Enemella sp. A6 TaxID=3440152 RepID=UPI003EB84428
MDPWAWFPLLLIAAVAVIVVVVRATKKRRRAEALQTALDEPEEGATYLYPAPGRQAFSTDLPAGAQHVLFDSEGIFAMVDGPGPLWTTNGIRDVDLHTEPLGTLTTWSGAVGAWADFLSECLEFAVPPGEYPVFVTIATIEPDGEEPARSEGPGPRNAYLSLLLSSEPVAQYELAGGLGSGHDLGLGVDAGVVAFADARVIDSMTDIEWPSDELTDEWLDRFDQHKSFNTAVPGSTPETNVVFAESGWGDGSYRVLKGYAADGTLVSLTIELGVLEDHYAALDDLPPRYRTFDPSSEKVLIARPLQEPGQSRDS